MITVFQIKTSFAVLYSFTCQFKAKKGATIIYNVFIVCFEQLHEKSKDAKSNDRISDSDKGQTSVAYRSTGMHCFWPVVLLAQPAKLKVPWHTTAYTVFANEQLFKAEITVFRLSRTIAVVLSLSEDINVQFTSSVLNNSCVDCLVVVRC